MQIENPRFKARTLTFLVFMTALALPNAAFPETSTSVKPPIATTRATLAATPVHTAAKSSRSAKAKTAKRPNHDDPGIRSSAALVIDTTDSSVLFSKQPDEPAPIASITKLMTALVVLEANQPSDEVIQVEREDRESASRIEIGSRLSRENLLHVALMSSDNRAAHAVARSYPGGLDAMIKAMNAKARELGMTHTHFVEPTGLSAENVASPRDLTKLVNAAAQNQTIREFSTDESQTLVVGRRTIEFRNTNSLVRRSDWEIQVQKTGYTSEAGRCLVMKTVIQGRPLVIVLLDSFGKNTRVADARRIRKWLEAKLESPDATTKA